MDPDLRVVQRKPFAVPRLQARQQSRLGLWIDACTRQAAQMGSPAGLILPASQ